MAESKAECVWHGNLVNGNGETKVGSGVFGPVPVSWSSRTQEKAGKTSPEELIAAAHASCYCMALSNELTQRGHAPTALDATAVVSFEPKQGGGWHIASSKLSVKGTVPGIDQTAFQEAAQAASKGCPVSQALAAINVSLESATLES